METFKQARSAVLVASLSLLLTLGAFVYRSDVQALRATNEKQDTQLQQLMLAVERLKALYEVQVQLNEQLVRAIEADTAAHLRDSGRNR